MTRYDDLEAAMVELLSTLNASPDKSISLYAVGPPLVAKGYTQDEIVNALYSLQSAKTLELMEGNRVRVLR